MTNEEKFDAFHAANPVVYSLFKRFAIDAIKEAKRRGRKAKISSKAIIERIRWEADFTTTGAGWSVHAGKPFKINNIFTAWYSRQFIKDFPAAAGILETRKILTP